MVPMSPSAAQQRRVTPNIKQGRTRTAEEQQTAAQILALSRLWWPNRSKDAADQPFYEDLAKRNAEIPNRICIPESMDHWFDYFRPELTKGQHRYARVPLKPESEVWYFFHDLASVSAFLQLLSGIWVKSRPNTVDRGHNKQRVKLPWDAEHYASHLRSFLEREGVVHTRLLLPRENAAWYFVDTAEDVCKLLRGVEGYVRPLPYTDENDAAA